MKKLLATATTLLTLCATGGIAAADQPPPSQPNNDGPRSARLAADMPWRLHVLGIPYDEYIRRTGAEWFPGLNRQIVDYPAARSRATRCSACSWHRQAGRQLPGPGYRRPEYRRVGGRR